MSELVNKEEQILGGEEGAEEKAPEGENIDDTGAGKEGAEEEGAAAASGDKGGEEKSWTDDLDPEYRDDPSISKYKSANEMAKGVKNLVSKLGADKIASPKDDWTKEQWAEFYDSTGRPAEYNFEAVSVPEPMQGDDGGDIFKEMAHEHGLSQKQAEGIFQTYLNKANENIEKAKTEQAEQRVEARTELRKEWGAKYPANMKLASKTFMEEATEEQKAKFIKYGWADDPDVIKLFAKLGGERSEDVIGDGTIADGVKTPDEAQQAIAEIKGNKEHPYFIKGHPEHEIAKARMDELYAQAYPEEKSDVITE